MSATLLSSTNMLRNPGTSSRSSTAYRTSSQLIADANPLCSVYFHRRFAYVYIYTYVYGRSYLPAATVKLELLIFQQTASKPMNCRISSFIATSFQQVVRYKEIKGRLCFKRAGQTTDLSKLGGK